MKFDKIEFISIRDGIDCDTDVFDRNYFLYFGLDDNAFKCLSRKANEKQKEIRKIKERMKEDFDEYFPLCYECDGKWGYSLAYDGWCFKCNCNIYAVSDDDGNLIGYYMIASDHNLQNNPDAVVYKSFVYADEVDGLDRNMALLLLFNRIRNTMYSKDVDEDYFQFEGYYCRCCEDSPLVVKFDDSKHTASVEDFPKCARHVPLTALDRKLIFNQ